MLRGSVEVAVEERTYTVGSIHCGGCERTIREGLGEVEGIEEVEAAARTNAVVVRLDPDRVPDEHVRSRLAEMGFPVVDERDGAGPERGRGPGRFLLLVVAVAAVALAGYAGYVLFPRFDLPAVEGVAVLGLAAAAGVASFFSPCSFPLLLGLLGRHASASARGDGSGARPLVLGGALAVGAGAFLLLAGLLIAVGGGAVFQQVTFDSTAGIALRTIVGVLLVGLGLVQVGVLPTPFHAVDGAARPMLRRQARLRRDRPLAGYGLFGFGYVLAGFG